MVRKAIDNSNSLLCLKNIINSSIMYKRILKPYSEYKMNVDFIYLYNFIRKIK